MRKASTMRSHKLASAGHLASDPGSLNLKVGKSMTDLKGNGRKDRRMMTNPACEQRKSRRFRSADGALAAFSILGSRSFTGLGEILDISESGLSLFYVATRSIPPTQSSRIDIFGCRGPHVHIQGIPCRVVYESEIHMVDDSTAARRCGVHFRGLTTSQRSLLEHYIKSYTLAESTS
jgi:hypothetical protein